jgi:hypothetical protein
MASRAGVKQFYGFIDDVAVFSKALSQASLQQLAAKSRLDGTESGLLRGWTFDDHTPAGNALPEMLNHSAVMKQGVDSTIVSTQRDNGDATLLPLPHPFNAPALKLPFKSKQEWYVKQGYATDSSHNGYAAFSLDLVLVGPESPNKVPNPYSPGDKSCGEPIYAVANGDIVWAYEGGGFDDPDDNSVPNNDYDGTNRVLIRQDTYSYATYLHVFTGSISATLGLLGILPPWGDSIPVVTGEQIATVGTRNGCHLHFGVGNSFAEFNPNPLGPPAPYVNYPVAFWNYEACDANCELPDNWKFVTYGVLQEGQHIRKP